MKSTFIKRIFILFVLILFFSCEISAQSSYFFYSFNNDPWTFNRRKDDGTLPITIYSPTNYQINKSAVDGSINKVYFYESYTNKIYKSDYDGTNKTTATTPSGSIAALAAGNGYIFYSYLADPYSVRRCNSDGSNDIQLYLNPSYGNVFNLAFDATNNYLYYYEASYDAAQNNRILRTDANGSNLTVIYNNSPKIQSLGAGSGFVYFSFSVDPWTFNRRNSDGSSQLLLYTPPTGTVMECSYDATINKLFYYDNNVSGSKIVYKANADGSNKVSVYSGFSQSINSLSTPTAIPVTLPAVSTYAASSVSSTSVNLGGNVTSDGGATITERGIVYSLSGINTNPQIGGTGVTKVAFSSAGTGSFSQSISSLTPGSTYYFNTYATNSVGTSYGSPASFTTLLPSITSATYDAATGSLVLTCANITTGDIINPTKITLTGAFGATYVLTTGNVSAGSSTSVTITLSETDKTVVNILMNENGTASTDGTTYNLAAADDWDSSVTSGNTADPTNSITVSIVAVPTITSATYNAVTGALTVTGTGFLSLTGSNNDIVANKFTIVGEGGATYTLTNTSNVDITSGTAFTLTLSANDKVILNQIINKNGTSSTGGTVYNLAAAEDWAAGADPSVTVADISGNGITATNVAVPTITSATYNAVTGALTVTGTGFLSLSGSNNDIVANKFTIVGEGGATYTLTNTSNVDITSGTAFTLTLSANDKVILNQIINKNGTSSTGGTFYNLAAAEDWAAGADPSVTVADISGNGITATNVAVPSITSATYNANTGAIVATGSGFLFLSGSNNDIVANKFTITAEGGITYTLTNTSNVDITSGTAFTLTLSATDKAAINQIINKNGTSSTGGTVYNLAAAEDWAAGADPAVNVADITGNGITASNVAVPTLTSATYNAVSGVLNVTGTGFLSLSGSANDIVANKFTFTGEGGATYFLTDTPNADISSGTSFTLTLSATDKAAVNQIINKNGTSSNSGTVYNLAAADDWAAGADPSLNVADATGNGITASGLAGAVVTTQAVTAIDVTSATGNGNITSLGVPNPTQYGVVWSTSSGPTIALSTKTTQGAASSTGAFTSNITGLSANTRYYVKAYATNSTGTSYGSEVQFTTSPSSTTVSGTTNWSTIAQWDNGAPASSSDVTVNGGIVTVDGTYTVRNATVNGNGGLSIGPGQTLNITGNLVLKSDGTNTSSLIINGGTLNVTGTVTVERHMTGNKWYIISPTASGGTVADFLTLNTNIPTSGSNRGMQDYNTASNTWNPYYTSGTGNMVSGKGYAARIATTGVVSFVGSLAYGDKSVAVTRTGDNGWNCIGNPYTSAIHIDANADATNNFLTVNSSNLDPNYAAIYVWDESGTNDGTHNYYDVVSNAEFTFPKTQLGQDRVQVGQGFFVKVKTSPANILFTPAMQIHNNTIPLKTARISWPAIELTVKTDSLSAFTDIAYNDRMTNGLDPTYDAGLLRGSNRLNIYSHLITDNGTDFVIQCLPDKQFESQVIPIGIDYLKGGPVKISARTVSLPPGLNVILEDRLNNTYTTLQAGNELTVTVGPNTKGIGRFYLHTTALSANDLKTVARTDKLNAYLSANNEIRIVGNVSSKAIATLFDTQGKAIVNQNLKESNLNVIPATQFRTGIYMLTVRDKGRQQSFKLFIKQ